MAVIERKTTVTPNAVTETVTANETPNYIPEKELFQWTAASRTFKRRSREFWVTLYAIASLLAFILFLAEGIMPVILIISLIFLFYVMSTVPPDQILYSLTNKGIKVVDKTTEWGLMTRFWFEKRMDSDLIVFELNRFPGRMELVVNTKDIEKVRAVVVKYIPEEKPTPTSIDKAIDWASKKLPQS